MKLRNLDVLRACLALMVLVGHARMLLWMGWQDWKVLPHAWWEMVVSVFFAAFRFGHQAVMVFFALSGFSFICERRRRWRNRRVRGLTP